ncbi:hypothetical protein ACRASX_07580 [Flavobacterium sp. TMP13]|uniref:hypothetical protein n=1 Tax=Flavobacterium sp. TMP13 TaxID=3425950 RepID=UPI003D7746B8
MGKQVKIEELTTAISNVIKKLYKDRNGVILSENNEYFIEFGKNLGLERYISNHNVTCSKLFAICDFLEISLSDFFKLVENEDERLKFSKEAKGKLVRKAYKQQ